MIKKYIIGIVAILSIVSTSCTKNKAEQVKPFVYECVDTISYSEFIVPEIINISCNVAGCHNSTDAKGGYSFTNYDAVLAEADLIYKSIENVEANILMPLGGPKLSDSLIAQFKCWIDQGKLNN